VRGVPLRGAHDIGWLHDLTVERLMDRNFAIVPQETSLSDLRRQFPLGSNKRAFVVDAGGRYAGMLDLQDIHSTDRDGKLDKLTAKDLAQAEAHFLTPQQPVRIALDLFLAAATEALPVVDSQADRKIVGFLTEAYALRRYNGELETRRREELGDDELFSPGMAGER
jgi:CIC family chloride channel protein